MTRREHGPAQEWLDESRGRLERARTEASRSKLARSLSERGLAKVGELLGRDPALALAFARATEEVASLDPHADAETLWGPRRQLASALQAARSLAEALDVFTQLLSSKALTPRRRADVEAVRAPLLARLGRPSEALKAAARARRAWQGLGDAVAVAQVDINTANILHRQEDHAAASRLYERARKSLARKNRPLDLALCHLGLGNTLSFLGKTAGALKHYRRAEGLFADAGAEHSRLVAAYNRHYLALLTGAPQEALEGLRDVRERFLELDDDVAAMNCDLDLAEVFLHLKAWPEARRHAERAHAVASRLGHHAETARGGLHLARALSHDGGAQAETLELLEATREIFLAERNLTGAADVDLLEADFLLKANKPEEARSRARSAAMTLERLGLKAKAAIALTTEAEALLARRRGRATPASQRRIHALLERAHAMAGEHAWSKLESRRVLAALAHAGGDVTTARREIARAASSLQALARPLGDEANRTSLLGGHEGIFGDAVRYWLDGPRPNPRRALAFAEMGRSMDLLEGRPTTLDQVRESLEAYRAGSDGPDEARQGFREARPEGRLDKRAAASAVVLDLELLNATELQQHLLPGEVLVEYGCWPVGPRTPSSGSLVAFVMSADSLRTVRLPPVDIAELTCRFNAAAEQHGLLKAVAGPTSATAAGELVRRLGGALSRAVLAPLPDDVWEAKRLFVVPHGPLLSLPFGSLPVPGGSQPLALAMELIHLPLASWLQRRAKRRPNRGALLAIGSRDPATPLVEAELRAVARTAKRSGREALLLSGKRATSRTYVEHAPAASLVHFAGHGSFRPDSPEGSALRFADRWVGFRELEGTPLRAEAVILSACRAGALQPRGGQFLGLGRALLRAGARSVIASPWTVPDELALQLFVDFHAELAAGSSIPQALRMAQGRVSEGGQDLSALGFGILGSPWCRGSEPS